MCANTQFLKLKKYHKHSIHLQNFCLFLSTKLEKHEFWQWKRKSGIFSVQVEVWVMTPCIGVVGNQCFKRSILQWRWRHHGPLKQWYPTTILHSHNPENLDLNVHWYETSNLAHFVFFSRIHSLVMRFRL